MPLAWLTISWNLHERAMGKDLNEDIFLIEFQVGRCLPSGAVQTTELTEKHHKSQKNRTSSAIKCVHHFLNQITIHLNLQCTVSEQVKINLCPVVSFPLKNFKCLPGKFSWEWYSFKMLIYIEKSYSFKLRLRTVFSDESRLPSVKSTISICSDPGFIILDAKTENLPQP